MYKIILHRKIKIEKINKLELMFFIYDISQKIHHLVEY